MDKDQLYRQQPVENDLIKEEGVMVERDPLTLELDDQELQTTTQKWIEESRSFFKEKYNLYERRKKNETVLFGRQLEEKEKQRLLKVYEARYLDNVIYEVEAALKPLAMSRLPDMIVTPGSDSPDSLKVAEDISKCLDTDIKKRQNRQVLGIGFKHLPVYFTAIIKVRWDPEKNDYIFENVHPDYIDVDHTCTTKDAYDMKWISQILPISVQECIMRFPEKKKDIVDQLQKDGMQIGEDQEPSTKALLSTIKIREIWFTWYKKDGEKWERYDGVMWKYKEVILKKMKNPNYDYEGETKHYSYGVPGDESTKKEITEQDLMMFMQTGQLPSNVTKEQIYRNYFDRPRKPFYFFGYDQWKKIPYDETSRIEQNIRNQENLDRRGKSIIDKLSARVKHIFSKDGGLKKDDIEQMDLDDPRQDILVEGNVNAVHAAIIPEQPSQQDFRDLAETRNRMYSLAGANSIRGEVMSDTATSSQIAREADFTRADDLVEDTISEAVEWMSQWALHMIKLRYTEDHFRKLSGARGSVTFIKLNRDMIQDGMEVQIKASGTDKLKTQKTAMEMAQMKMIDPLTFYRDMGLNDPEGRTEDLLLFSSDPASYLAKVKGLGSNTQELVNSLLGGTPQANQGVPPPTVPQAPEGQPPSPVEPQAPTPQDTGAVPVQPPMGAPEGSPRVL